MKLVLTYCFLCNISPAELQLHQHHWCITPHSPVCSPLVTIVWGGYDVRSCSSSSSIYTPKMMLSVVDVASLSPQREMRRLMQANVSKVPPPGINRSLIYEHFVMSSEPW